MCPVLFHSGTHVRGLWETLGLTGIRGQGMKGGEGLHLLHPPRPPPSLDHPKHVSVSHPCLGQRDRPHRCPSAPILHTIRRRLVLGQNQAGGTEETWTSRMLGPTKILENRDLNKLVMLSMLYRRSYRVVLCANDLASLLPSK